MPSSSIHPSLPVSPFFPSVLCCPLPPPHLPLSFGSEAKLRSCLLKRQGNNLWLREQREVFAARVIKWDFSFFLMRVKKLSSFFGSHFAKQSTDKRWWFKERHNSGVMCVGYNVSPPFFSGSLSSGDYLKNKYAPRPPKTCNAAIYQTLTWLYLCCCVLVGLVVLANSRPSWQIEPRFLKAPCAIHYGHVLNGNSSKPSTDLHAHLLSWSMSCSCCASRDCGRISTAFFWCKRRVWGGQRHCTQCRSLRNICWADFQIR